MHSKMEMLKLKIRPNKDSTHDKTQTLMCFTQENFWKIKIHEWININGIWYSSLSFDITVYRRFPDNPDNPRKISYPPKIYKMNLQYSSETYAFKNGHVKIENFVQVSTRWHMEMLLSIWILFKNAKNLWIKLIFSAFNT